MENQVENAIESMQTALDEFAKKVRPQVSDILSQLSAVEDELDAKNAQLSSIEQAILTKNVQEEELSSSLLSKQENVNNLRKEIEKAEIDTESAKMLQYGVDEDVKSKKLELSEIQKKLDEATREHELKMEDINVGLARSQKVKEELLLKDKRLARQWEFIFPNVPYRAISDELEVTEEG